MDKRTFQSKKNNKHLICKGFTLIECLVALFVLSINCLLFSAAARHAFVVTNLLRNETDKEWHIFLIQLENEVKNCYYEQTQPTKVIFKNKKNNHPVWIECKLGKIVKVENNGYHPLLTKISKATFKEEENAVNIAVVFENGQTTQAKLALTQEHRNENR